MIRVQWCILLWWIPNQKFISWRDPNWEKIKVYSVSKVLLRDSLGNIAVRDHPLKTSACFRGGGGVSPFTVSVFGYFCPKLQYMIFDYFNFFLYFPRAYRILSNISIVCHTLFQEVQEHSQFCSFPWKFRFLLLTQVGKQVQNFTGDPNSTIFAWDRFNQHANYKFSNEIDDLAFRTWLLIRTSPQRDN